MSYSSDLQEPEACASLPPAALWQVAAGSAYPPCPERRLTFIRDNEDPRKNPRLDVGRPLPKSCNEISPVCRVVDQSEVEVMKDLNLGGGGSVDFSDVSQERPVLKVAQTIGRPEQIHVAFGLRPVDGIREPGDKGQATMLIDSRYFVKPREMVFEELIMWVELPNGPSPLFSQGKRLRRP